MENVMWQVTKGACLQVCAGDVLNPAFGYVASLEGPAGKIRATGDTAKGAIGNLNFQLESGALLPVI